MRPRSREDAEDLAQEKLLAELEGKQFSKRDFWAKTRPSFEITSADVEVTARLYKPKATFYADMAANRDASMEAKVRHWCEGGASLRYIAAQMTKERVPKTGHRNLGKPWTRVGVLHMLRRLGINTKHGVGWGKMAEGPLAATWVHWTQRPGAKDKLRQMSALSHMYKKPWKWQATSASGARRGRRRSG